ncbi:hypothetical protein QFC21_006469 [Naganishia friedmannii]|uniref:Uncharacterized protein n=1 Tax=Naganishia friedmannii TaxID=89922 RepID=A0ACC2V2X2_9TREE|nr:hypothetical protein QFC21_006469 [Naganishia friedmannii]
MRCEEIATNCLEILQNLEGTENSRQQRKRRMVRASHEIVDQLQDLAYHGTWPTQPPGPTYGAHLAQAPGMHNPGSDFPMSSSLDVVARLERTNPEAAAEAARDMAAIRARTHGTFPDPPVEENRKER